MEAGARKKKKKRKVGAPAELAMAGITRIVVAVGVLVTAAMAGIMTATIAEPRSPVEGENPGTPLANVVSSPHSTVGQKW